MRNDQTGEAKRKAAKRWSAALFKIRMCEQLPPELRFAIEIVITGFQPAADYAAGWTTESRLAALLWRSDRQVRRYLKCMQQLGLIQITTLPPRKARDYCQEKYDATLGIKDFGNWSMNIFEATSHPLWDGSSGPLPTKIANESGQAAQQILGFKPPASAQTREDQRTPASGGHRKQPHPPVLPDTGVQVLPDTGVRLFLLNTSGESLADAVTLTSGNERSSSNLTEPAAPDSEPDQTDFVGCRRTSSEITIPCQEISPAPELELDQSTSARRRKQAQQEAIDVLAEVGGEVATSGQPASLASGQVAELAQEWPSLPQELPTHAGRGSQASPTADGVSRPTEDTQLAEDIWDKEEQAPGDPASSGRRPKAKAAQPNTNREEFHEFLQQWERLGFEEAKGLVSELLADSWDNADIQLKNRWQELIDKLASSDYYSGRALDSAGKPCFIMTWLYLLKPNPDKLPGNQRWFDILEGRLGHSFRSPIIKRILAERVRGETNLAALERILGGSQETILPVEKDRARVIAAAADKEEREDCDSKTNKLFTLLESADCQTRLQAAESLANPWHAGNEVAAALVRLVARELRSRVLRAAAWSLERRADRDGWSSEHPLLPQLRQAADTASRVRWALEPCSRLQTLLGVHYEGEPEPPEPVVAIKPQEEDDDFARLLADL